MEEYDIDALLDPAEPVDGGMTNDVWLAEADGERYVIKEFAPFSKTQLFDAAGTALFKRSLEWRGLDTRMETEDAMKGLLEEADVNAPDVLAEDGNRMLFAYAPGDDAKTYMEDHPDAARAIGELVGTELGAIHDAGGALIDARLTNIHVEEDGPVEHYTDDLELHWMDHEYARTEADAVDRYLDQVTLMSSAGHLDRATYTAFRDGFEDGYGADIDRAATAVAAATSPGHALLLERDLGWTANAAGNTAQNAYGGARDAAGAAAQQGKQAYDAAAGLVGGRGPF